MRSHVLTLREGELESRLRDRERDKLALEEQLKTLTPLLRQEQVTRGAQARRIAELEAQLEAHRRRLSNVITRGVAKHRAVAVKRRRPQAQALLKRSAIRKQRVVASRTPRRLKRKSRRKER